MSAVLELLRAQYGIANPTTLGYSADRRVIRVASAGIELAVKQFAPADAELGRREAGLLALLVPADPFYRVQIPLQTSDGALLASHADGAVLVTHWCPGQKKVYTDITGAQWHALGAELAALHARLSRFTGSLPRASELVVDLAAERDKIAAFRNAVAERNPARCAEIVRYLDARLALLDAYGERGLAPVPGPEHAIHNDYNQHNYLFDDRLPPIILDWEGAIAAPQAYEVVRCMNHLPLVAAAHATAFVRGYRSLRALDHDALRWGLHRSLLEHAKKNWPLERWLAGEIGAAQMLAGSMEVLLALHDGLAGC